MHCKVFVTYTLGRGVKKDKTQKEREARKSVIEYSKPKSIWGLALRTPRSQLFVMGEEESLFWRILLPPAKLMNSLKSRVEEAKNVFILFLGRCSLDMITISNN